MSIKMIVSALLVGVFHVAFSTDMENVDGVWWTYDVCNNEAHLVYNRTSPQFEGSVKVPSTLGGYPVARIGTRVFYFCTNLVEVTMPGSVRDVGSEAFLYCTALTNVVFSSGITNIEEQAFSVCLQLKKVQLPEKLEKLSNSAFSRCSALESVSCGDNLRELGKMAFYATKLTSFFVPAATKKIGEYCFGSSILSFEVDSANSVYSSQNGMLLTKDGKKLVQAIVSGAGVVPDTVQIIGPNAFKSLAHVETVYLDEALQSIDSSAFGSSLRQIVIPPEVSCLSVETFIGSSGLTNFVVSSENSHFAARCGMLYLKDGSQLIRGVNCGDLVLPSGTKTIGAKAFYQCTGVTSIVMPHGVEVIGNSAFVGCSCLTNVVIPITVKRYDCRAFDECPNLRAATFPHLPSWDSWGGVSSTFPNLKHVTFADGVTEIWDLALLNMGVEDVTLPQTIKTIGWCSFYGCSHLKSMNIPKSVRSIGIGAVGNCTNIIWQVIPSSVTNIGSQAFAGCSNLKCVMFEGAAPRMQTNVFNNVHSGCAIYVKQDAGGWVNVPGTFSGIPIRYLRTSYDWEYSLYPDGAICIDGVQPSPDGMVEFPAIIKGKRVEGIGKCFSYSNLLHALVPSGIVEKVGNSFSGISRVKGFVINGLCLYCKGGYEEPVTSSRKGAIVIRMGTYSSCYLNYDGDEITKLDPWIYYQANGGVLRAYPETVEVSTNFTSIAGYAFANCNGNYSGAKYLKEVILPTTITNIGRCAFQASYGLTKVALPSSIKKIEANTFSMCRSLNSVTIPEGVEEIGESAFLCCSNLTTITIPSSVRRIGKRAFMACARLKEVIMLSDDVVIGELAFKDTPILNSCPSGLVVLYKNLIGFKGECPSTVVIPDGVKYVCANAFSKQATVKSVVAPSSLIQISDYAFYRCSNLDSITLNDGLIKIGEYSFSGSAIRDIHFPTTLCEIGTGAFSGCDSLVEFIVPKGVCNLAKYAVSGCDSLKKIQFHEEITNAFVESIQGTPYYESLSDGIVIIGRVAVALKGSCPKLLRIPEGVYKINPYTFYEQSNLNQIILPSTLQEIGGSAFCKCTSLTAVCCLGRPPQVADWAFERVPDSCCFYVDSLAPGWGNAWMHMWARPWQYSIHFDAGAGSGVMQDQNIQHGDNKCLTKNSFVRTGYSFNGWHDSKKNCYVDEQRVVNLTDEVNSVLDFLADWTPNAYTISFDSNGGDGQMTGFNAYYGDELRLNKCCYTKANRIFVGWSTNVNGHVLYLDGQSVSNLTTELNKNVTLFAVWRKPSYTVTFDPCEGAGDMPPQKFNCGETQALCRCTFSRNGYEFTGWRVESDGLIVQDGAKVCDMATIDGASVCLKACWNPISYDIEFCDTKGCYNNNRNKYTVEDAFAFNALTNPPGWYFIKWNPSSVEKGSTGRKTVTANWGKYKYAIVIDGAIGDNYEYGQSVTVKTDASKTMGLTNIVCLGWVGTGDIPKTGVGAQVAFTVTKPSMIRWLYQTNYWVSTECNGGGSVRCVNMYSHSAVSNGWSKAGTQLILNACADQGWHFNKWVGSDGAILGETTNLTISVDRGYALLAVFGKNEYEVTFDLCNKGTRTGGGELVQYVTWGECASAPSVSASKNYIFNGWNADFSRITSNLSVCALYLTTMPLISAEIAEGCETMGSVSGANKQFKTGSKVSLRATAKRGYVCTGWFDSDGVLITRNSACTILAGNSDVKYFAKFIDQADDVAAVRISLPNEMTNGVTVVATTVDVSDCVSFPTVKVMGLPTGLKFTSKALDIKSTRGQPAVHYDANTIYGTPTRSGVYTVIATVTTSGKKTASCTRSVVVRKKGENVVKVDVSNIDGVVPGKVTGAGVYATGKTVTLKATANKGFVFAGWHENANGGVLSQSASYLIDKMPSSDVSLRAAFITTAEDKVNISAKLNGMSFEKGGNGDPIAKATNIFAGVYLEWPVAASAFSQPTIKVSGLPSGLKFTAKPVTAKITTGSGTSKITTVVTNILANTIYGAPSAASKAGKPSVVKLTVTTAGKSSRTYQINTTIDPLPTWAQGSFDGGWERADTVTDGGQVSLAVSSAGKVSGKALGDGLTYTIAAPYYADVEICAAQPESLPCQNTITSFLADVTASWSYKTGTKTVKTNKTVRVSVCDNGIGGCVETDNWFEAYSTKWKIEPWKSLGKKFDKDTLTYVIKADGTFSEAVDDLALSLGEEINGRVTLKFASSGKVTVVGEFVSGYDTKKNKYVTVKSTGSSMLIPEDDEQGLVFVYLTPKGLTTHARCLEIPWPVD